MPLPITVPSSPTPHHHTGGPLVPDPHSPHHGRQLTRASSAAPGSGYVTAAGLQEWKRGIKRSSREQEKDRKKSKSSKKGLGMGMQGTPARKRRTKSKSIGFESTPQASAFRTLEESESFASSLPSSIDDIVDNSQPLPSPLGPFSPLIPRIKSTQNTDVFGATVSIPDFRSLVRTSQEEEFLTFETLFPEMKDLTVPVDFHSSTVELSNTDQDDQEEQSIAPAEILAEPRRSVTVELNADTDTADASNAEPNLIEGFIDLPVSFFSQQSGIRSSHMSITHEDLTVPLKDSSDDSKQLKDSLSQLSKTGSRFSEAKLGSNVKGRVSTPFRRPTRSISRRPAAEKEGLSTTSTEESSEKYNDQSVDKPIGRALSAVGNLSDESVLGVQGDTLDVTSDHPYVDADWPLGFESDVSNLPKLATLDDGDGSSEYSLHTPPKHRPGVSVVCPYIPSSRLNSDSPSPTKQSIIEFSPTPSVKSVVDNQVRVPMKQTLRRTLRHTQVPLEPAAAIWRGAKVLARMEEYVKAEELRAVDLKEADEEENHSSVSFDKHRARRSNVNETRITDEELRARQRRIEHYRDIEQNYQLRVELVLW